MSSLSETIPVGRVLERERPAPSVSDPVLIQSSELYRLLRAAEERDRLRTRFALLARELAALRRMLEPNATIQGRATEAAGGDLRPT